MTRCQASYASMCAVLVCCGLAASWDLRAQERADAPVRPVEDAISQTIGPSTTVPAQATEPQDTGQFTGEFGHTPPGLEPIWVYAIKNNGDLLWYRKDSSASAWQGPKKVGNGWENFTAVIPAGGPNFYALTAAGILRWYRHDGFNDGSPTWKGPRDVGRGWRFSKIFSGGDGIVYAIRSDGALIWYRHDGFAYGGGIETWQAPKVVGSGWGDFIDVFSMGKGIIYAVTKEGRLLWYRHDGFATGATAWTSARTVGSDWQRFRERIPVGGGVILSVAGDGRLFWYKHLAFEGKAPTGPVGSQNWEGPTEIGVGWQHFQRVVGLLPTSAAPVLR